jgi:methionyl-tRNA formyltransferase
MSQRIVLLANDAPGLAVAKYLVSNGDEIVRLYLHEPELQKLATEITVAAGTPPELIFSASALRDAEHVEELRALRPDYIITVYWAHLLTEAVISTATKGTVNFHPALLPINRGWYPHVHSIIDGTPTGVTLHAIDATADTGPIWAQREVPLSPYDTADTIYYRLQDEIVRLFQETWPLIASGQLTPVPQDESKAIYRKKSAITALDRLDLDATMTVRELVNLLRARTFGTRGFAYYEEGGQRVYLNLRLSPTTSFE